MSRLRGRLEALEAVLLLVVAHGLRRLSPMTRWSRLIGSRQVVDDLTPGGPASATDLRVRLAVRRAVARLSRLPVTFTCLDQAVAGSMMLQRRSELPVVVVGLDRDDPANGAHAWLVGTSGCVLLGGEVRAGFVPVTAFRPSAARVRT